MPKVEVAPLVKPCPSDEKRSIDCGKEALIEDILAELEGSLGKGITLYKELESGSGIYTKLCKKESPPAMIYVKGVHSISALPASISVSGFVMPSTLTKDQALAIQLDTMANYQDELFTLQMKQLQKKLIDEWKELDVLDPGTTRTYMTKLRTVLQPVQAKFFRKHGFEATPKGMATMQGIFNSEFADDQEIQDNVNKINFIVGTDYNWLPPDLVAKQGALPTPAPKVAAAPKPVETKPAPAPAATPAPQITQADIEASEVQE